MTLSKDDLIKRKDELASNIETLQKDIVASENQIKTLRNNLNAMAGALQLVDMFLLNLWKMINQLVDMILFLIFS